MEGPLCEVRKRLPQRGFPYSFDIYTLRNDKMKICITSQGDNLAAAVDPRFGRAQYFVFYDTDSDEFEAVENASLSAAGGAGIAAAKTVIDAGAKAVLTGNCGPKAMTALKAAGIAIYSGLAGTVDEAIKAFGGGKLTETDKPSVADS